MSTTKATEDFNASREGFEKMLEHEDENVRLAAKIMLKRRYGEEVSL